MLQPTWLLGAQEHTSIPSTVEGFKASKEYVLERHIGKYQAIDPHGQRQGLHRG